MQVLEADQHLADDDADLVLRQAWSLLRMSLTGPAALEPPQDVAHRAVVAELHHHLDADRRRLSDTHSEDPHDLRAARAGVEDADLLLHVPVGRRVLPGHVVVRLDGDLHHLHSVDRVRAGQRRPVHLAIGALADQLLELQASNLIFGELPWRLTGGHDGRDVRALSPQSHFRARGQEPAIGQDPSAPGAGSIPLLPSGAA
mmetsp:Transcript_45625/g.135078  ORF Transcript_45625/g.135078 Transcript_45625/m.135078 type:complete len:201 (-) Transcript_45625:1-603(-)